MNFLFLDFETFYDNEYSLRKMTPAEYILDPRYETICVACKVNDGPTELVDGPDFREWLSQYPPDDTVTVTYNALFDNCILAWHYGYVPKQMIDALGMARSVLGVKLSSLSLEKVAAFLEVGTKGHEIAFVKGMNRAAIMRQPQLWEQFKHYAVNDTDLLYGIWKKLHPTFSNGANKINTAEYRVLDMVLRAAVCPRFRLDEVLVQKHLAQTQLDKENLLVACGATKADLMSTASFAKLLGDLNVEVEQKVSPTGNIIPALAKTDDFMARLLEHDDPKVQALAAARLGHKSTLEETRALRLLSIASLNWQSYRDGNPRLYSGGTMPIPLRYAGAHTHRLSGDWRMNMQNLPRGSVLRNALIPPPGHKVIVADLGQIEARLTAWMCHDTFLEEAFKRGADPYRLMASVIWACRDSEVTKTRRFIGKACVLGLGFGAGHVKFYNMVLRSARAMNMDMSELSEWTPEFAEKTVRDYRRVNHQICAMWRRLDDILATEWKGINDSTRIGPCLVERGTVTAPGGLKMRYEPVPTARGEKILYSYGARVHEIYGSKFLENIIQFLARVILFNAALRIHDRGYDFALQCHDELAFIVHHSQVEEALTIISDEMTRRPTWAPDLPLTADVQFGDSYGDAK